MLFIASKSPICGRTRLTETSLDLLVPASASSWADDGRDDRPETCHWHFVDLALAEDRHDAAKRCHASDKGDCIVAELERVTPSTSSATSTNLCTPLARGEAVCTLVEAADRFPFAAKFLGAAHPSG